MLLCTISIQIEVLKRNFRAGVLLAWEEKLAASGLRLLTWCMQCQWRSIQMRIKVCEKYSCALNFKIWRKDSRSTTLQFLAFPTQWITWHPIDFSVFFSLGTYLVDKFFFFFCKLNSRCNTTQQLPWLEDFQLAF